MVSIKIVSANMMVAKYLLYLGVNNFFPKNYVFKPSICTTVLKIDV